MKKYLCIVLAIALALVFCACNRQVLDLKLAFTRAEILYPDGRVESVKVSKWADYESGDEVQIVTDDGTVILTHYSNVILYSK